MLPHLQTLSRNSHNNVHKLQRQKSLAIEKEVDEIKAVALTTFAQRIKIIKFLYKLGNEFIASVSSVLLYVCTSSISVIDSDKSRFQNF